MNEQFTLPDGTVVGTGLMLPPPQFSTNLPVYEDSGPMWTWEQIDSVVKAGLADGRKKFDKSLIKNQRNHGSCNGFAGSSAQTRARMRRGLSRVDLSGAYLYSLINGNRDNGSMLDDGMNALMKQGCAEEQYAKWNQIYRSQYDTRAADASAARFKADECYAVGTKQGLFSALAAGFDCVVAVHVESGFNVNRDGVVTEGRGPGNHAVGCDGAIWDEKYGYLTTNYNSWDVVYGIDGRMLCSWEYQYQYTTKYHKFYAIRTTGDDPQGNNPPVP